MAKYRDVEEKKCAFRLALWELLAVLHEESNYDDYVTNTQIEDIYDEAKVKFYR